MSPHNNYIGNNTEESLLKQFIPADKW